MKRDTSLKAQDIGSWPPNNLVMKTIPFERGRSRIEVMWEDYASMLPEQMAWLAIAEQLGVDSEEPSFNSSVEAAMARKLVAVVASGMECDPRDGTIAPPSATDVNVVINAAFASGNPAGYLEDQIGKLPTNPDYL